MILVLDNYDSFTYNLVQYVGELGGDPVVYRNDALTPAEAMGLAPAGIIISPGPGTPTQAGISIPLVRAAAAAGVPLLGVCLGHQAIGAAFSGRIERADRLMHGKTTSVTHRGVGCLSRTSQPGHRDAIPLACGFRECVSAGARNDRVVDGPAAGTRDHGPPAPESAHFWGAIPSRIRRHGGGPYLTHQLSSLDRRIPFCSPEQRYVTPLASG